MLESQPRYGHARGELVNLLGLHGFVVSHRTISTEQPNPFFAMRANWHLIPITGDRAGTLALDAARLQDHLASRPTTDFSAVWRFEPGSSSSSPLSVTFARGALIAPAIHRRSNRRRCR